MLELLQFPFVQRAIISGLILGLLFAVLGVYVILRNMAFWGDGIAHASLAGIAFALFSGSQPLLWAIIVSVAFAVTIFFLERHTTLSNDALIGVLFTSFMALGVVILSFIPGYQPELISFLFGNILTVGVVDILIMSVVGSLILIFVYFNNRALALQTFDRESAYLAGINTDALDLLFYISLAVSVVLGVKVLGVVLVSALLIIPASIAKMVSRSYKSLRIVSVIIGEVVVIVGMMTSLWWDIPSGPSIILVGAILFLCAGIFKASHIQK